MAGFGITSNDNPFNNLEKMKAIQPKKLETPTIDFKTLAVSNPATQAPKKGFLGNIFGHKKNDVVNTPTANNAELTKLTDNMGANAVSETYDAAGLSLSANKPVGKTVATTSVAQAAPKADKTEVQAGATPKEDKEDSVNEEGSLGDLQDKKQEIVDSKKGDATKVLSEKSERFQKLDGKSKAIDDKLTELKKNPEGNADEIAKLEAKKGRIDSKKSGMVEHVAEKIASKDKGYQELSKAEAKEQKKVDQYANYELTDKDGNKLSPQDISNLGKQGKLFDEKGKPVSKEEFKKQGFEKTLTDEAAAANPELAMKEGTSDQKFKAFAMMMSGGNPNMIPGGGKPQPGDWAGALGGVFASVTAMNEQRKAQQRPNFGTFSNFG
jgi:hypothetical protein